MTKPAITSSATPSVLWPPNGRLVPVTVSGVISGSGSGVASATYHVRDSYGEVQPSGEVIAEADGQYTVTLMLPAPRHGADRGGRRFVIEIAATGRARNTDVSVVSVLVPRDIGDAPAGVEGRRGTPPSRR